MVQTTEWIYQTRSIERIAQPTDGTGSTEINRTNSEDDRVLDTEGDSKFPIAIPSTEWRGSSD